MIIVGKKKDTIVNVNNVMSIYISDEDEIYARCNEFVIIKLGKYEDKEVTKTVFNQVMEAVKNGDNWFEMPE